MSDDLEAQLAELRQLRQKGVLSEAAFRAAVAGLRVSNQAQVRSDAAAHGDHSTAVGQRGVNVGGNVGGSIITGNVYHGPPAQNPAEAIRIYCRVLAQSVSHLPLRGVDVGASDPTAGQQPLGLANVYVDLDTTTPVHVVDKVGNQRLPAVSAHPEWETRPLSALEATVQNHYLVLLGEPGGGKSTFVSHLAHCLAAHIVKPKANWLGRLRHWPAQEAVAIPLLVILRDFAQSLPDPLPRQAEAQHLWDFITGRLRAQNLDFAARPLAQALEAGRAFLLCDGLDEVTSAEQRLFVRDAVLALTGRYPRSRALVTCRVLSYQKPAAGEPDLRLPEKQFPTYELAPFDETRIGRFIDAWYAELARLGSVRPQDVAGLTGQFRQAVRRPDLWQLAANPLLLTVMALVHTHKGRLPDARALLYEETVDILLWRWEQVKAGGQADAPPLRQLLLAAGRTDMDLKRTLWRLAYQAHSQIEAGGNRDTVAGIGELALRQALARLADNNWTWAHQVVEAIKLRAGLLLEREPQVFSFPHRTVQEFLAGAHLSAQGKFAGQADELAGQGANWREVILLAVGRLVYLSGDTDKPLALVARLCPAQVTDSEAAWRKAWLAGDVLLEMGLKLVEDDALGQELLARVQQRLVALVSQGKLAARERAEAGDTLARVGDPRPGVCTLEPETISISAGAFLMGEERHEIALDAFAVARYPVTNAQFRAFVDDGGYTDNWRDCWTDEGWQEREKDKWAGPRFWDDERFNQPNQPVVAVSWYEAVAYCRWLKNRTGRPYRLPTEAEWERAVRHTDGRDYPWGNRWQDGRANSEEAGLNRTTAVGAFPGGAAVCGAQDMSGNVLEWCSTRWQDEEGREYPVPYRGDDSREELGGSWRTGRVIRGGSAWQDKSWLRCAFRLRDDPDLRNYYLGFRVVVSPF